KAQSGFQIGFAGSGLDLSISPGRMYVDGMLCELQTPSALLYSGQPSYPNPPPLSAMAPGIYLAYLDVWLRHVTALEDPQLREPALAGADTTTRTQNLWQVKLLKLPDNTPPDSVLSFPSLLPPSNVQLRARTQPTAAGQSGYRRLQNQLYRVEVH